MKLKLAINKELDVMTTLGISAEEWLFIQLLWLFKEGEEESLLRYFTQAKKDNIPREILESLKEKNIIQHLYEIPKSGEGLNPLDIPLSKTFISKYLRESGEMGLDLLSVYPPFIVSGVKSFPMTNIAKSFRSLEDFSLAYGKAIRFNLSDHEKIISLIEWAKENNAIHFSLAEFVISKKWELIEEIKEGRVPNYYIPTFDTAEML